MQTHLGSAAKSTTFMSAACHRVLFLETIQQDADRFPLTCEQSSKPWTSHMMWLSVLHFPDCTARRCKTLCRVFLGNNNNYILKVELPFKLWRITSLKRRLKWTVSHCMETGANLSATVLSETQKVTTEKVRDTLTDLFNKRVSPTHENLHFGWNIRSTCLSLFILQPWLPVPA